VGFALLLAGCMWLIKRWHQSNLVRHPAEVAHLMDMARRDPGHS
jgi:hypothetical protein